MQSAGDDLIHIDAADPAAAQSLAAGLRESGDWMEVVGGIASVVVRFDLASMTRNEAERRLAVSIPNLGHRKAAPHKAVEIPIVYGGECGPDLERVCDVLAITQQEFIAMHCGKYTVEMPGFVPGFAYVGGLDSRLNVDRLREPRQHVPAGSVGIAAGRTGLYALPGPGGWPLVGRTTRSLFDSASDDPFTLSAGTTVIFSAVDAH